MDTVAEHDGKGLSQTKDRGSLINPRNELVDLDPQHLFVSSQVMNRNIYDVIDSLQRMILGWYFKLKTVTNSQLLAQSQMCIIF